MSYYQCSKSCVQCTHIRTVNCDVNKRKRSPDAVTFNTGNILDVSHILTISSQHQNKHHSVRSHVSKSKITFHGIRWLLFFINSLFYRSSLMHFLLPNEMWRGCEYGSNFHPYHGALHALFSICSCLVQKGRHRRDSNLHPPDLIHDELDNRAMLPC